MNNEKFPIYRASTDNSLRYYLGTKGEQTLLCCGINPSTASKEKSDATITKISRLLDKYGYDSFVMINIYPKRSTYPFKLPDHIDKHVHSKNLSSITNLLNGYEKIDLLVCWGNNLTIRNYFYNCLIDIWEEIKLKINCTYNLGELTKPGHPRHPSRISYETPLKKFIMKNYLDTMTNG